MPPTLKDTTVIPNWMMSILVVCLLSVFGLGWTKVDKLEKKVITSEQVILFRSMQIEKMDIKLDEILTRMRALEKR